jgi:putative ABC transport system permease protein
VLAAIGLKALLGGFGISLPPGPIAFEARTAIAGLVVGVGVTVVAAIGPARQAVRIAPVAALSDRQVSTGATARRRLIWGAVLTAGGAVLLGAGLGAGVVALVGIGAVCVFIGVTMLSPAIARPLSSVIGRPLARLLREPGKLGRENSMRSPRRTAQTASALMVGLALVSAMAVFGASLSRSATSAVADAISADLLVTPSGSAGNMSTLAPSIIAAVPGVTVTETAYQGQFEFKGTLSTLTAISPAQLSSTVVLHVTSGSAAALSDGDLLIDSATATSDNLKVGDLAPAKFAETGGTNLRIGGIYKNNSLIGSFLASSALFRAHFLNPQPAAVLVDTGGSASVDAAVQHALAPYPNMQVQTKAQYEQSQASSINQVLGLVYVLLALAVVIALIGIVNTLMLSVFERTREIGLLRAVGMRRQQIRAMIRSEAVILAIFGAVIGIVVGTIMGLALVSALGLSNIAVPVPNLVLFLVLAAVLGLLAASWPARRAARLDVLAAIATN